MYFLQPQQGDVFNLEPSQFLRKDLIMMKGTLAINGVTILDAVWFHQTTTSCIGIVLLHVKGENIIKAYIGLAKGENEALDMIHIAEHGSPFPINAALELMELQANKKLNIGKCYLLSCDAELKDEKEWN